MSSIDGGNLLISIFISNIIFLAVAVHITGRRLMIAYDLCREVLSQLGEKIPEKLYRNQTTHMTEATHLMVSGISDTDLLEMKEMDTKLTTSMGFYCVMKRVAFLAKPEMIPFLACRVVQLTMKNGLCMHSITGFILLAAILCKKSMGENYMECAKKIGKAAMTCFLQRYNVEKLPGTYSIYYTFVAWHSEPLQICVEKLRQGFEVGISLGESHLSFYNSSQQVMFAIIAGERLPTLLEKVDYYLRFANTTQDSVGKQFFSYYHHTIKILISGGEAWWMDIKLRCLALLPAKILENIYFYSALKTYWQGHTKRCQYYVEKMLTVISTSNHSLAGPNTYFYIVFINGLTTFELMKNRHTATAMRKLKSTAMSALTALKKASEHSSWNFENKVRYLQPADDSIVCSCFFFYGALQV